MMILRESNEEWWKKLIFVVVEVLTVVAWVYELGLCLWVFMWTPLVIWRIETIIDAAFVIILIVIELFSLFSALCSEACCFRMRKCLMTTFSVFLYTLGILAVVALILALLQTDEQVSFQYAIGTLYALANLLLMTPTVLLFYYFFAKSDEMKYYQSIPYQPVPRYFTYPQ